MIINYESIYLESVKEHHIEQIRCWRNSDSIKKRMLLQEEISIFQQSIWYKEVIDENQMYFVCSYKDELIGLIYANEIDWEKKICFNSGIFIIKEDILGTGIPFQIAMLFTKCGFTLGIKENRIIVRNDNFNAIKFNKLLGYECIENQDLYSRYSLTEYSFNKKTSLALQKMNAISIKWEETSLDIFIKGLMDENTELFSGFNSIF